MFRASFICAVLLCVAVSAAPKRKFRPEHRENVDDVIDVIVDPKDLPEVKHYGIKYAGEPTEDLTERYENQLSAEKAEEKLPVTEEEVIKSEERLTETEYQPEKAQEVFQEKEYAEKSEEKVTETELLPEKTEEQFPENEEKVVLTKTEEPVESQSLENEEKQNENTLLRQYIVEHEGQTHEHTEETPKQESAQSSTQELVKEEAQETVKEESQETVQAETLPEEEQKPQPEKVLEVSNALPLKLEEETLAVKSYLVHPKLTVQETIKEFQAVESPKIPLVSLSQVKDDLKSENELEEQDSKPAQQEETKPEEQTEQKEEEQTEVKEEEKKSEDEVRVLSPVLTLPKDENKDSWSIVVKQRTPDREEEIIPITKTSEDREEEKKSEEQKPNEEELPQSNEEQDVKKLKIEEYEIGDQQQEAPEQQSVEQESEEQKQTEEKQETEEQNKVQLKLFAEEVPQGTNSLVNEEIVPLLDEMYSAMTASLDAENGDESSNEHDEFSKVDQETLKEDQESQKEDQEPIKEDQKPLKEDQELTKEDQKPTKEETSIEESPKGAPLKEDKDSSNEELKSNLVAGDENIQIKDIKEDIIKDVGDALKGKIEQVQTDILQTKQKFEERFQAVRERIKIKNQYIQEAIQQKKDKINDFIDKFIFNINTTSTSTTEGTGGPTTEPTGGTDPPPGPPDGRLNLLDLTSELPPNSETLSDDPIKLSENEEQLKSFFENPIKVF